MSIQTSNLEAAAVDVQAHPAVHDARIVDRGVDGLPTAAEIVLEARVERVPPGVLRLLAKHDCGIASVQHQGEHLIAAAQ